MIKIHSSIKNGQSLVEMALLLPALLLLTVVTFDIGRAVYYYSAIYNAAREGARFGIINPSDGTGIENAAKKITVGLDQGEVNVSSCECGRDCIAENSCPANYKNIIQVKVTYTFQLITPLANVITGRNSITLESTSFMAIER